MRPLWRSGLYIRAAYMTEFTVIIVSILPDPPVLYEDKMDEVEKENDPEVIKDQHNIEPLEVPNQPVIALDDHMNEEQALEAQSKYFSYFVLLTVVGIVAYLVFHNKKKVPPHTLGVLSVELFT